MRINEYLHMHIIKWTYTRKHRRKLVCDDDSRRIIMILLLSSSPLPQPSRKHAPGKLPQKKIFSFFRGFLWLLCFHYVWVYHVEFGCRHINSLLHIGRDILQPLLFFLAKLLRFIVECFPELFYGCDLFGIRCLVIDFYIWQELKDDNVSSNGTGLSCRN